jgi:uncharacterized protein YbaR (Trm112 family)
MIRFACPGCSSTFTVPGEKAGKASKCPKCGVAFQIPEGYSSPAPQPAPVPGAYRPLPPAPPANIPVEIHPCPKCQTRLSVLAADVGSEIQCPQCRTVYQAARADGPPPSMPGSKRAPFDDVPSRRDDDEEDRPRRKKKRRAEDDDDDDDEDYAPPVKKRRTGKRAPGTVSVTRLGPLSVGLNAAAVYAIMALVFGLFFTIIFGCLGAIIGSQVGDSRVAGLLGMGVLMSLVYTVIYVLVAAVSGFIGGVVFALIYNIVAKGTGGIEMDLE